MGAPAKQPTAASERAWRASVLSEAKRPGSGAGTFFLGEIEKTVRKLGITTMFLLTDSNVPAFHFYKKNGFVQEETNVAFFKCLED